MPTSENLSPQVLQRIMKEIRCLVSSPPDGIQYLPNGNDCDALSEIYVEIRGPEDTPYDGGYFKMKLVLTEGFPQLPPKGYFLTKIYHPNISNNGDICVNTLKRDWKPELGILHVVQVIRCLLIVPFPESSLNDEAGRLFMDSYEEYARRAKLMTNIHAPKKSHKDKVEQVMDHDMAFGGANIIKRKSNQESGEPTRNAKMTKKKASLKRL